MYTHVQTTEIHACLHKQTQLPDNKIWLRNQIESVIKYDERRDRERLVWEKSTVIISIRMSSPLHSPCPNTSASKQAEADGSTQLNATTCYPRVSAYASLGLISSDKPNISGEFTPLGLTCQLTPNYTADCTSLRSVAFPVVTWYWSES